MTKIEDEIRYLASEIDELKMKIDMTSKNIDIFSKDNISKLKIELHHEDKWFSTSYPVVYNKKEFIDLLIKQHNEQIEDCKNKIEEHKKQLSELVK